MGIVAWGRALFGGGNPAIAQQWADAAPSNPDQIAPAPGAFPWAYDGPGQQQLIHPLMPHSGALSAPVGRWGGNQSLGPDQVIQPAISPVYAGIGGVRNVYAYRYYNVPKQAPSPGNNPQYAGAPNSLAPVASLSPELVKYLNQS